ncbi:hypothetical protein V7161_00100 [Neobacillus drentensis]|uniref:hypothetical protein n=1 Tax=Neobacillus drentensis TaxID=220684 RepID=UPI002FFFEDA5
MLGYIRSLEFWITIVVTAIMLKVIGLNDLANYIQVFSVFQFSYIIHKLHKHHKLLKSLTKDE